MTFNVYIALLIGNYPLLINKVCYNNIPGSTSTIPFPHRQLSLIIKLNLLLKIGQNQLSHEEKSWANIFQVLATARLIPRTRLKPRYQVHFKAFSANQMNACQPQQLSYLTNSLKKPNCSAQPTSTISTKTRQSAHCASSPSSAARTQKCP